MIRWSRRFLTSEDGSMTIEFVLLFPFIFGMFLATFELGMLLSRQVMLERGLDLAVREVRLGLMDEVTHDHLKEAICDRTMLIPDCMNQLKLEMSPIDPRAWARLADDADCVDRSREVQEVRTFTAGVSNELMMLRACVLIDPYFPSNVLGFPNVDGENGKGFALVSTSAFVIEPI